MRLLKFLPLSIDKIVRLPLMLRTRCVSADPMYPQTRCICGRDVSRPYRGCYLLDFYAGKAHECHCKDTGANKCDRHSFHGTRKRHKFQLFSYSGKYP